MIRKTLAAGIGIKEFFAKSRDNDPAAYTTDVQKIASLWNEGQRRFKAFIYGRFLAVDIDRHPGKADGLENFYKLFLREILPEELRNLPESFPCYTQTPSGGFHLYFRYEDPELKLRELAPGIEIKEWQITTPGSRRENGDYILHGEFADAPPLYGLILDVIEDSKRKKEQVKAERSQPRSAKAATDRPIRFTQPRITLDTLADEAITAHAGHHDRQVSFAGRAYRCKFSGAETLA
ncbi:MAG: bifunctional DNA primase/polymerase, partial [Treponema sp.]|nr:bifunctional DNA primase/polymerase [Treponema sp.]